MPDIMEAHGKSLTPDFVTVMMALFIVLWLLNTSKPVREAIAGYFKDPSGTAGKLGTTMEGKGEAVVGSKTRDGEVEAGNQGNT